MTSLKTEKGVCDAKQSIEDLNPSQGLLESSEEDEEFVKNI